MGRSKTMDNIPWNYDQELLNRSVSNAKKDRYMGYPFHLCYLSTALQISTVPRPAGLSSDSGVCAQRQALKPREPVSIPNAHNAVTSQSSCEQIRSIENLADARRQINPPKDLR